MKFIIPSTVMALVTAVCAGNSLHAQNATITGNISGLKADNIVAQYHAGKEPKTDTIKLNNGKFTWKVNIDEPQEVYLFLPTRYYPFFVQSGKINLKGISDSTESYVVTGSAINDEATAYAKTLSDLTSQEDGLYKKYGRVSKEEQTALELKLNEIRAEKRKRGAAYVAAHPSSYYSMHLISSQASYGAEYSDVKHLYDMLDEKAKGSAKGASIADRLDVLKRSAIGTELIDFTQNDTTGNPVRYSSLKGKYILIDFWASWCGPCRAENPNVLKAYNAFADKNFTVLGISLDDKGANWKKAIREDKMPWVQLSDLKGWKNELSTYYGIQGIPSNFLIDPSGKIVAKDLRGELLQQKLAEILN